MAVIPVNKIVGIRMKVTEKSLPFSQACENNKNAIFEVIKPALAQTQCVLEIGSGTAQHAVYFSQQLPGITWIATEIPEILPLTQQRLTAETGVNIRAQPLDVMQSEWPSGFDAVFTANTLHIMSWHHVTHTLKKIGELLPVNGICIIYGPFNYGGHYTSESNQKFDAYLKERNPLSGIRDFEKIQAVLNQYSVLLLKDSAMPANNRTLVWKKTDGKKG